MNSAQLSRQFVQYVNQHYQVNLSDNLADYGISVATQHYAKQAFLFRQGEPVNDLWFVANGLFRYVVVTSEGKEFTKHFAVAPGITGSTKASVQNLPSQFGVQALTDCLVLKIDWRTFSMALEPHPEVATLYTKMLEALFMHKEQREYDLVLKSAEQRYLDFQQEFADVAQDIPLQYVASFIGITPVALSRIRKRLL